MSVITASFESLCGVFAFNRRDTSVGLKKKIYSVFINIVLHSAVA